MEINPQKKGTILIIDDELKMLYTLFDYLEMEGYKLLISESIDDALEKAKQLPDIILLDVKMEPTDGFEVCQLLKENSQTQDIPIIFMTAYADIDNRIEGFKAGGVDYITKPFYLDEILMRVHTHITLQRQKKQLAESNMVKNRFFSIIAHDLRSPMITLKLGMELLRDSMESPPKDTMEIIDDLKSSIDQMNDLLKKLLQWGHLQMNTVKYDPQSILLKESIAYCQSILKSNFSPKNINVSINVPDDVIVYADINMIHTIFRNLLSNAVKFIPDGGHVWIDCQQKDEMQCISVADNGVGIEKGLSTKLFDLDRKSSYCGTNMDESSGLGLILCKEMVERNGGQIWVESVVGEGTTFYFTLPIPTSDKNEYQ